MANKQRDLAKESRWRDILKRHTASGLSVRAFCQQEQVTESSFYAWRRTIGGRSSKERPTSKLPAFVPAVVTSESLRDTSIAIELAGRCVLRLPESISATRIAELVHALETRVDNDCR